MTTFDWRDFFESVSQVEKILRTDPPDVYAHMDRATRDRYRRVVEELALASGHGEEDVATAAIALARGAYLVAWRPLQGRRRNARHESDDGEWGGFAAPPTAHVGYYLVDDGRATLEERLGIRPTLRRSWHDGSSSIPSWSTLVQLRCWRCSCWWAPRSTRPFRVAPRC